MKKFNFIYIYKEGEVYFNCKRNLYPRRKFKRGVSSVKLKNRIFKKNFTDEIYLLCSSEPSQSLHLKYIPLSLSQKKLHYEIFLNSPNTT